MRFRHFVLVTFVAFALILAPAQAGIARLCATAVLSSALAMGCLVGSVGCGPSKNTVDLVQKGVEREDPAKVRASAQPTQESEAVRVGEDAFIVREGMVFRIGADGTVAALRKSFDVAKLIAYRGQLVARQNDGDVYLWSAEKQDWLELGHRAKQLGQYGDDLFAVTTKNELWRYKGEPGPVNVDLILVPIMIGNDVILMPQPMVNGRKVAFSNTGVKDVSGMLNGPDGLVLQHISGNVIAFPK